MGPNTIALLVVGLLASLFFLLIRWDVKRDESRRASRNQDDSAPSKAERPQSYSVIY